MKNLLICGHYYQTFGSFPVITQTDDGITWDTISFPFPSQDNCSCIATDNTYVATSNMNGNVSITTDFVNFVDSTIHNGFGITGLDYTGNSWIAAGSQLYVDAWGPYGSLTEVAQLYRSTTPYGPWDLVNTHPQNNSRIYMLKHFYGPVTSLSSLNVWVSVGKNSSGGDIWYSLDHGQTWVQVSLPAAVGTIYSVGLSYEVTNGITTPIWIWGCSGKIYKSYFITSPSWLETTINTSDTIVDQAHSADGRSLIAGINSIYTSNDNINFISKSVAGYQFDRVFYISSTDRWIAFGRSLLNQYTYWTTTDFINWYSYNNNVHVSGHTSNS
jgi:hypothetical protein